MDTTNPFQGQRVRIQIKTSIIYEGVECKDAVPPYNYESEGAVIEKWLANGVIITGGYFIPNANIAAISPYKSAQELEAVRAKLGVKGI